MRLCLLLSTLIASASASRLWATHYNGHVYTLDLAGNNTLSVTDKLKTCGGMPSWLTFDAATRTLYCSDEDGSADPSTHGSLTALHAAPDGKLREMVKTEAVGGGVSSAIYGGKGKGKGKKYLAIAHYGGSAISTFSLPLHPNQRALQAFHFNLTHAGAVAQQDASHPHEVFLDPTGSFIVSPDLGADLLRVYAIDTSSGRLHGCPSVNVTFGSGPRHGVFWSDSDGKTGNNGASHNQQPSRRTTTTTTIESGKTLLYVANEIGGTVMVYDVSYPQSGCLSFAKKQTLVPYTHGKMPHGATPAGIHIVGDALYVSIRSDQGFAPSDSMVTLDRSARNGSVALRTRTPAYGKVPRTFALNRAGDLVAIGNQASATVAVVRRDRRTGELGEKVAVVQVGGPGKVGAAEGLSSVIWEE
ncbi:hypothetical protein NUU61_003817 [Penicillium alfredii]|uniref:6-phosphogluconolactonase n=1 Tax=Penicillium alfredii TaxID=1506179 RepID=A0A9W9KCQ5_9EURO|nr:uncharacterized protein NUU61_003817 [Penicillium alfredii]KAJ5101595.1 hypothetical protein NUU61_003817 [Penicillium alfredii]